jgi:hypothetical protein
MRLLWAAAFGITLCTAVVAEETRGPPPCEAASAGIKDLVNSPKFRDAMLQFLFPSDQYSGLAYLGWKPELTVTELGPPIPEPNRFAERRYCSIQVFYRAGANQAMKDTIGQALSGGRSVFRDETGSFRVFYSITTNGQPGTWQWVVDDVR